MSARHLQATKPIPSAEYKSVGAIILTTLAFDKVPHQPTSSPVLGGDRPEQQHGAGITASTSRFEATNPSLQDLVETEEDFLTKALTWECHELDDDHKSSHEKHLTTDQEFIGIIRLFWADKICNQFKVAELRHSEDKDPRSKKSMQIKIHPFLNPANRVDDRNDEFVEHLTYYVRMELEWAEVEKEAEKLVKAVHARFQSGEFEKHLYSSLRQLMLDADSAKTSELRWLVHHYAEGVQKWCASIFDATVRRVKFAIEATSGQSLNAEKQLHEEILKAHDWLETYLEAEPNLREAVNKIKGQLDEEDLQEWVEYEKKHSLNSPIKMEDLEEPFRSMISLSQNTHFISWYLRRPRSLLNERGTIIEAIKAIEGESSIVVDVLENLCVQDLAAFRETCQRIDGEQFHRYVTVPQE
eukprot:Blabericola_migrator_1__4880@NODE_2551_length_2619_cov_14_120298_g1594_i0_p1_GENE_NODE_2551_length_2619_cov_14_120298_g1594_i0NODE_2551_length_2619_cov_14_120298_g1594_i0_p1_ORF_typecomplete_len413_score65_70Phage_TAC_11/PF11836_8/11Phage_TAC_11/PF11836_8/5_6DUF2046/PF09755_9/0_075DUF2046/PF09755_9/9e02DUF2046/PF09755_9/1_7e03Sp38/PF07354_12/8_3e02Sp38/PF07354_12/0_36Sp38/PF07354_12/4_5e03MHB/PF16525_5/0_42_NODE_2551_length_2619_cov_14_120298_g1594_i07191957